MTKIDELLMEVEKSKDELVELLQFLVRIPTVNTGVMPTGNETELCKFLKRKMDLEGIDSEVIESAPTRGNFVARLGGAEEKARLLLMSHTDVVPAGDESKWSYPPFSGELSDGRIYGRGSDDCKGLVACDAMVMILLKRLKIPLKKSLIMAAGADEETGSKYGFQWLARNSKEKIAAEFAINEAGGDSFQTPKGLFFTVAIGEKGRLDAKIHFSGKSCHASVPWEGDNALIKLSRAVQCINSYQPEINLSARVFHEIPRMFDIDESEIAPGNIDNLISKLSAGDTSIDPALRGLALRGLSRMTITPTMASGGIKSNVVPDAFTLVCDVRVLPGQNMQYVRGELEKILCDIKDYKLEINGTIPVASPANDEFLKAIRRSLVKAMETNVDVVQSLTVGLTDSCAVRPLGTIVYNFAPTHPDSDQSKSNVHGVDESISVEDIVFRTKVLASLAYDMLT